MPFQKGNKLGRYSRGVPRRGGGNIHWLQDKCAGYIDQYNLIGFLTDVALGKVAQADTRDRLKAVDMLLDRGFGKPSQQIDHGVAEGRRMVFLIDGEQTKPNSGE